MGVMAVEVVFQLLFATGILVAAAVLAAGVLGHAGRLPILAAASLLAAAAAAGWVALALLGTRELALSAGGLTAALLVALGVFPLRRALARAQRLNHELDRAERRLGEFVEERTREAAAELERVLARARADSVSLLAEEERRIGEERRLQLANREHRMYAQFSEALAEVQRRVEVRLTGWADDLERAQQNFAAQFDRLAERQREMLAQAQARVRADVERLEGTSEEQRAALVRLREELGNAAEQIIEASEAELEEHAAGRRRALHELGDRLRRRERELREQIEHEEAEAAQRIQAGFADVERRALDQLERATERAWSRHSEEATQQFADAIKAAREDAARRLSRELDRAVEAFARESATVLAEKLAHVGDAGAQRLEKRISSVAAGVERQRDELFASLEQRLSEAETEIRRRLRELAADAEAERSVIEARLQDLSRRVEDAAASREQVDPLGTGRLRS
jgi:hypothetical protein